VADPVAQLDEERGFCGLNGRYNADDLRAEVTRSPSGLVQLGLRGLEVVSGLGFYALSCLGDSASGGGEERTVRARAQQLRELLARLGPSFIKAGQVLANRPDIVRSDYMVELCELQDNVPAFPNSEAFAIMERELGRPPREVFSAISEEPVAAASLGQVYRATLRSSGEEVAVKVQRPGVAPNILRDLVLFRWLGGFLNAYTIRNLGCNAQLIVDEFGEKLLEELDYEQEARNIVDFRANFEGDPYVKIPWVNQELSGPQMLVMEWIDGVRCTDLDGIRSSGIDVEEFMRVGVVSALRQLLEFGLFHGDPHPGNLFAMRDGRIAYVDFGNVAQISQRNKQVLVDAVIHAVNEDYEEMAGDFTRLGFLSAETDTEPVKETFVPALETIWKDSMGQSMSDFNFRTVTSKFNKLVYQFPIRIPERYALVIRSLLTQEGICMTLSPDFHFLEVAYPYVARRLLTDEDPELRQRLTQVLFKDGQFQWQRLQNLLNLAKGGEGLDLSDTVQDGAVLIALDDDLREQVLNALTQGNRIHLEEVQEVLQALEGRVDPQKIVEALPQIGRKVILGWADKILSS
jgi:predicted unusual protein kinase regulating ubiquinone biosynthesis (AarF/ABC1/UbiB family)